MKELTSEQIEIKGMIDELKNRKKELSRDVYDIVCNIGVRFNKCGTVKKKELQTLKNLIEYFHNK